MPVVRNRAHRGKFLALLASLSMIAAGVFGAALAAPASAAVTPTHSSPWLELKGAHQGSSAATFNPAGQETDCGNSATEDGWHFVLTQDTFGEFAKPATSADLSTLTSSLDAYFVDKDGNPVSYTITNWQVTGGRTTESVKGVWVKTAQGVILSTAWAKTVGGLGELNLSHTCPATQTPPPVDLCENVPGDQLTYPYPNNSCTEPPVDLCENVPGDQLTYPYPNNSCTEPPVDLCENVPGDQLTYPYPNNSCTEPPVDLCENVPGDQLTYPYPNNSCTEPPVDLCENVPGDQLTYPYPNNSCTEPPVDLCENVPGDQLTYPYPNNSCTEPPVDLCENVPGDQLTYPYPNNSCTEPPVDLCENVPGDQLTYPYPNNSCTEPPVDLCENDPNAEGCTPAEPEVITYRDSAALSASQDICTVNGTVRVDVTGNGLGESTISQPVAKKAAEGNAQLDLEYNLRMAKAQFPGATEGACAAVTTAVAEPAVIEAPAAVALPEAATVQEAPQAVAVPAAATVPTSVPAGEGPNGSGFPAWALVLIVAGAAGAALSGALALKKQ